MTPPRYVAAIDIGGTTIKSALADGGGVMDHVGRRPTRRDLGPAGVLAEVHAAARELVRLGTERYGGPPAALGVASLGVADADKGVALYSGSVGWRDVPLRADLSAALGLPVVLCQDVYAGAVAEHRHGAAAPYRDFLFLALGTGVGGAVFVNGLPYVGAHSGAGELGHLIVEPGGDTCVCGRVGCLETVASAPAIERAYARLTGVSRSSAEICALIERDPDAAVVWARAVKGLAAAIDSYCVIADPACVVLGGGVALAGDDLLRPLRAELERRPRLGGTLPHLVIAALGDDAACVGAATLALDAVAGTAARAAEAAGAGS